MTVTFEDRLLIFFTVFEVQSARDFRSPALLGRPIGEWSSVGSSHKVLAADVGSDR